MSRPPTNYFLYNKTWKWCILASILLHFLVVITLVKTPIDRTHQIKTPEKNREFIIIAQKDEEVAKKDTAKENEDSLASFKPDEKTFVKTNEEQQSATKPDNAKYQSHLNTRAEGGRQDPNGDADMPTQDGEENRKDIVLFDQDYQDGDWTKTDPGNLIKQANPTPPTPPAPLDNQLNDYNDEMDMMANAGSLSAETPIQEPPADPLLETPKESLEDTKKDTEKSDELVADQDEGVNKIDSLTKLQLPQTIEIAKTGTTGVQPTPTNPQFLQTPNKKQRRTIPYDPIFAADAQPGANTVERKTKTVGRFSFGRRAALDVEKTAMGVYQMAVYRAIANVWYLECDTNRDKIVTGVVNIRIHVNKKGQVVSMKQLSREGASEAQNAFTMKAIKEAKIPAIPVEVQQDMPGQVMEFIFNFYF